MLEPLLFALLLLAVAMGYGMGVFSARKRRLESVAQTFDQRFIAGLNHLLGENTDEAIATLIQALELSPDTLDTYLALGGLLRRRGEVAEAIAVHQQLLAITGLNRLQRQSIQLELAHNYLSAGLYDRAEALLIELEREASGELKDRCLSVLIDIYQSEGEWRKAIACLERVGAARLLGGKEGRRQLKSQFCCELAEVARAQADWREFRYWVDEALVCGKSALRPNFLLAQRELMLNRADSALKTLMRVVEDRVDQLGVLSPLLLQVYRQLGCPIKLRSQLFAWLERSASITFAQALAVELHRTEGAAKALELFEQKMVEADVRLLPIWGRLQLLKNGSPIDESGWLAQVERVLAEADRYQCGACGFKVREYHWQCPSCKSWHGFDEL